MTAVAQVAARLRADVEALPAKLRDHILRVESEAMNLARHHGEEPERASIAALGHDLVRHKEDGELLALAARYGIEPDAVELAAPILVHGPVAARMLVRDYGVEDEEIVAGVDCHTTARAGMTLVEKLLFVADKIEPSKLSRGGGLQEVFDLRETDLDGAIIRYLDLRLAKSIKGGGLVHPRLIEARNDLLARKTAVRA